MCDLRNKQAQADTIEAMKTFNGLPLYEDMMTGADCGMLRISLVDLPAVEADFQKFGKPMRVVMASEEKRLILGCVMRADFPIYRVDEARGEYYTLFSKDTIRKMAEKYLAENRQNRVNLMHCGEEVRGVQMVQLFIKDSAKGVVPAGFEDIEDGSLFAEFHIEDESVWEWVKNGILRGFSLEGIFELGEANFNKDMDFKKMKRALAKIVARFAETSTDKGVLTYEGELEVGKDVYLLNADGEVVDAPDGEYKTEDGKTIVVEGGKVSAINEVVATEEAEEDAPVSEESPEQIADDVDIHNLAAEVERLKEELGKKDEQVAALESRVAKLEEGAGVTEEALAKISKMATAKPAHEEVKEHKSEAKFATKHQQFLADLNAALRK